MKKLLTLSTILILTACSAPEPSPVDKQEDIQSVRTLLTLKDLSEGFSFTSPVDEAALTIPSDASDPTFSFEGRLELIGETASNQHTVIKGSSDPGARSVPSAGV